MELQSAVLKRQFAGRLWRFRLVHQVREHQKYATDEFLNCRPGRRLADKSSSDYEALC